MLAPDRLFDPEPSQKSVAMELYAGIKDLPIISPHGHVDPNIFTDPYRRFGNPVELLIQPDHYVTRMLFSQGIPYDQILSTDDPLKVWQIFARNFHIFRATPTGVWLEQELNEIFGIDEKLTGDNAVQIFKTIDSALKEPEFAPRALFEAFKIKILASTDTATDELQAHQMIHSCGWKGNIIPTFRPDTVMDICSPTWKEEINQLSLVSGIEVCDYTSFVRALEQRREFFKRMGAKAIDIGTINVVTRSLSESTVSQLFFRAVKGEASEKDAAAFSAHMLMEMARMCVDDGLVMQLHPGSLRSHNLDILNRFGPNRGFDIPVAMEFTRSLQPLLNQFGNHPNFSLILFTLDETTYTRELAPLAGVYPSVKLGPPWWFNDSVNGMRRYFDQVMETAGIYNTAGFNDDTRAFPSIPARHDIWRRASVNWLSGLVVRKVIDRNDAGFMAKELAIGLAEKAYKL
jgi:glucuronate isomerase